MKPTIFIALALALVACGESPSDVPVPVLDLEAAIDNPRQFDLTEIASEIEFTLLDDTPREALIGQSIRSLDRTVDNIYIHDYAAGTNGPIKIFDRTGRFVATRGVIGRGPQEILGIQAMALDPATGNLYIYGPSSADDSIFGYDAAGRFFARFDSLRVQGMNFFDGELVVLPARTGYRESTDPVPGTMIPAIDIFSPGLQKLRTVERPAQITARRYFGLAVSIRHDRTMWNGDGALLFKEFLSDTLFVWRDGALSPRLVLDLGRLGIPEGVWGQNPSTPWSDSFLSLSRVIDAGRYLVLTVSGDGVGAVPHYLIIDGRNPGAGGFSAVGPDGGPGLFVGGVKINTISARDGRLLGYIQALDIVDNAASITHPQLKTIAATLKEDSNPVIVTITLNR